MVFYRRLRRWSGFFLAASLLFWAGCAARQPKPYPLGIYAVGSMTNLPVLKEAGFTMVRGGATKEFLDAAHSNGLQVLASPGSTPGPKFNAAKVRAVTEEVGKHPALWAWYIVDEPDLNKISPEHARLAERFVKRQPGVKPTALVLYQGPSALYYADIPDILMIDRYPIPWLPLSNFAQHLRDARLAAGEEKPLIAVIQAFDWSYYPDLLPGYENLRAPTEEEIRCMTYLALAHRANGIFYYCYQDRRWTITEHPETWEGLKRVVQEVRRLQPLFEAEHLWWPYSHRFTGPDKGFNESLESSINSALLRVREGNENVPSGDYILIVNNTAKTYQYSITVPEEVKGGVPVFGEERTIDLMGSQWLRDTFGAYEVRIYGPLPGR